MDLKNEFTAFIMVESYLINHEMPEDTRVRKLKQKEKYRLFVVKNKY